MATATTTTPNIQTVPSVDDAPEVKAARAVLQTVIAREAELTNRVLRFERVLDPYADAGSVNEDEVLFARENVAATRVQHVRSRIERRRAEAAWQQARATACEELRVGIHEQKRVLVKQLDPLLKQAAVISRELADLEDRERAATGRWHATGFAWFELAAPTPTQGSRFEDWRQAAIEAALLDEK